MILSLLPGTMNLLRRAALYYLFSSFCFFKFSTLLVEISLVLLIDCKKSFLENKNILVQSTFGRLKIHSISWYFFTCGSKQPFFIIGSSMAKYVTTETLFSIFALVITCDLNLALP